MSIDGRLLVRAKTALEERRSMNDSILEQRHERVYARVPRVRVLDAQIRATMIELVGITIGGAAEGQIEDLRRRNLELQDERRRILILAGFDEDYLDDAYACKKCNDSGYIRTAMCACLLELYRAEQRKSLSNLLKLGDETFDNFDLSYYDDTPAPDTGISPRRSMEIIYETCVEYARKFGKRSMNLFFNGNPGLGKTFLSACIANVVADSSYSVVYDMASSIFSKFEDAKFMRTDDQDEARAEVRRCLECDLLIFDDLGTEMTTAFTVSALYEIINTRLVTGKKTIVSSNLEISELRRRYNDQIMSRLEGEYQLLTFRGDDIRKKRNAL